MKAMQILAPFALLGSAIFVGGCPEEQVETSTNNGSNTAAAAKASASATASASAQASAAPPYAPTEDDFVESEASRDPFRDFSALFFKPIDTIRGNEGRKVKAATYSLDELRLVGIITRSASRAMLVDPKGYGWIVYNGDFVGKAELVNTGGSEGQDVPVNWRVDRIRAGDVVFVREDPSRPNIARTPRVIPLYATGDARGGS
jgi:type IV pilus assembly protein PilP